MKYNSEQLRILANLGMAYDNWMALERQSAEFRDRMTWKKVGSGEYLYRLRDRDNNGTSLGPRSAETEAVYSDYTARRKEFADKLAAASDRLQEIWPLYRAARLPMIAPTAGAILREADKRLMLGMQGLLVIGTTSMVAYELEAGSRFISGSGLDATEDFDMHWARQRQETMAIGGPPNAPVFSLFKAVDSTFTVNMERNFQVRNSKAYEVDILVAPSREGDYPSADPLRVLALPEQEALIRGRVVDHVCFDLKGDPARIVAPDPRWMALHKQFLADKPGRDRHKVSKDERQAQLLVKAVTDTMPHYPFDAEFIASIPEDLVKSAQRLGILPPEAKSVNDPGTPAPA